MRTNVSRGTGAGGFAEWVLGRGGWGGLGAKRMVVERRELSTDTLERILQRA